MSMFKAATAGRAADNRKWYGWFAVITWALVPFQFALAGADEGMHMLLVAWLLLGLWAAWRRIDQLEGIRVSGSEGATAGSGSSEQSEENGTPQTRDGEAGTPTNTKI